MTRADMIAALTDMQSRVGHSDAALLRALADALREGQDMMRPTHDNLFWIIPEPKVRT